MTLDNNDAKDEEVKGFVIRTNEATEKLYKQRAVIYQALKTATGTKKYDLENLLEAVQIKIAAIRVY